MNPPILNLLPWRTHLAVKKILHDACTSIFLSGLLALGIELGVYGMQIYSAHILHNLSALQQVIDKNSPRLQAAKKAQQNFLHLQQIVQQQKINRLPGQL